MSFDRHYLMYSIRGAIRLEAQNRLWTLPPSYAAWIPANCEVVLSIERPTTVCSVLFSTDFLTGAPKTSVVFTVTPLAREMIGYCKRWGVDEALDNQRAVVFFKALGELAIELANSPFEAWSPTGQTDGIRSAVNFTRENLGREIELADVIAAAGMSERSLIRHYSKEIGMSWRQSLRRMRMIRAMELLGESSRPIVQIALDVGYSSLSAFNKAFREFCGTSPSGFRASLRIE